MCLATPALAQSNVPSDDPSSSTPILFAGLMMAGGVFAIVGGITAPDWFINSPRAALFRKLFGKRGTQVFYVILGMAIVAMSIVVFVQGSSTA